MIVPGFIVDALSSGDALGIIPVPPDKALIKMTGDTLSVDIEFKVERWRDWDSEVIDRGSYLIYARGTWNWFTPAYNYTPPYLTWGIYFEKPTTYNEPILFPVDRTMRYDPDGPYSWPYARITPELVGKPIKATFRATIEVMRKLVYGPATPPYLVPINLQIWTEPYRALLKPPVKQEEFEDYTRHDRYARNIERSPHPSMVYHAVNALIVMRSRDQEDEARSTLEDEYRGITGLLDVLATWDTLSGRILPRGDWHYNTSDYRSIVPAGEAFSITHRFTNFNPPYKGRVSLVGDGVSYQVPLEGGIISFPEPITMPYDDIARDYSANFINIAQQANVQITKIVIEGEEFTPLPLEVLGDYREFSALIKAGFPNLKLLLEKVPDIFPAGDEFSFNVISRNEGFVGETRVKVSGEIIGERERAPTGWTTTFSPRFTMPWDDTILVVTGEVLGRGKEWTETDRKEVKILAGFPLAVLEDIDAPEIARPGERIRVGFPIRNDGFRGDVGVRVRAPGFERDIMQRIDRGASITPTYTGEMPPAEAVRISVTPIHLGRNREVVAGESRVIEIKPINCLLHWENFITIRGGYREFNPVSGFIAGKNLRIRGLESSIGTGGPPFLPYGGYILSGNLGPGDIATIEYDELYYFRVETDKEIATAMFGSLIQRATTLYEYSTIPTPAMVLRAPRAFGTMLTEATPRLEVPG